MISLVLYALLGVALAVSGVSVLDKPVHFIAIMAIVTLIDRVGVN